MPAEAGLPRGNRSIRGLAADAGPACSAGRQDEAADAWRQALAALRARRVAAQVEPVSGTRGNSPAGPSHQAPLFDLPGFARQLEGAFRTMWRHRSDGSRVRPIIVGATE